MTASRADIFAGHELVAVVDGLTRWWLKHPDQDIPTATIDVTGSGLKISGSHGHITLHDFVGELEPSFLADTFLAWSPIHAQDALAALMQEKNQAAREGDAEAEATVANLRRLRDEGRVFSTPQAWRENVESLPLAGYDPATVGFLTATHDAFRRLFLAEYRFVEGQPEKREA